MDFFKAFISCVFNAKYIGLIFIAYGVCDSIGSIAFGHLIKLVGRWPCFIAAMIVNYILIIVMFVWKPTADHIAVLFIIAAFWGLSDAVWQTQLNAFYGVLFIDDREAGFSNYRLWESIGFAFFYVITPYIRVRIILIILTVFLSFGMIGYILTEYRLRLSKRKHTEVASTRMTFF